MQQPAHPQLPTCRLRTQRQQEQCHAAQILDAQIGAGEMAHSGNLAVASCTHRSWSMGPPRLLRLAKQLVCRRRHWQAGVCLTELHDLACLDNIVCQRFRKEQDLRAPSLSFHSTWPRNRLSGMRHVLLILTPIHLSDLVETRCCNGKIHEGPLPFATSDTMTHRCPCSDHTCITICLLYTSPSPRD